MEGEKYIIESVRQDIVNENVSMKALIQDIHECKDSMDMLNELNSSGREKIASLRSHIERLETLAFECTNFEDLQDMLEEVKNNRDQLTSTIGAFRKANVHCMIALEKADREDLVGPVDEDAKLRKRLKKDKVSLVKASTNVTEQLLSISRQLADTTQLSSSTLDTLVNSSGNVTNTQQELHETGSVISQSSKLLAKYGRREFTDKMEGAGKNPLFWLNFNYIVGKNDHQQKQPTKPQFKDNWTWNQHDRSPRIQLEEDGMRASFSPEPIPGDAAPSGVRGTRVLNGGRHYWEIQLEYPKFGIIFGICTKKSRLDSYTGGDNHSWGMDCFGYIWLCGLHSPRLLKPYLSFRVQPATKFGLLFDGVEGTLSFYKDGKYLGVAFRNLHKVREPLFPVVMEISNTFYQLVDDEFPATGNCLLNTSMTRSIEISLTSLWHDVGDLQARCRSVILLEIKKNGPNLKKLELPPAIRNYLAEALL